MRVVLTAAIMDMCHEGHLNLLRTMKETGRKVIVVLHDDQSCWDIKGKIPIQNIEQRTNNLLITGLVDEVYVTQSVDPADRFEIVIDKYDDILFIRGDDNKDFPGKWIIDENNIPTILVNYTEGISSSQIRKELCLH